MSTIRLPKAVSFDLGETLIHYVGLPLNWQGLYGQTLGGAGTGVSSLRPTCS